MFKDWKERNFPTVKDNDKSIDKQYIIQTLKEYFTKPKNKYYKVKSDMEFNAYQASTYGLFVIMFILYIWYEPATVWLDSILPQDMILGTNIFMFIGLMCVIIVTVGYIEDALKSKKELKGLDKNA